MAYAIIKTGGKQYKVAKGDVIEVEKLEGAAGDKVSFAEVLFHSGEFNPKVSVSGEVVEQFKGEKVIAFKYRKRKGYHRTVGHRQKLTRVKITDIKA